MNPSTRARKTDPATSHEAADAQAPTLRASQARVLAMFKLYGDMHDKQLEAYLHDAERAAGIPPMSPSGIRSRRNELAKPNMERLAELRREHYNKNLPIAPISLEEMAKLERDQTIHLSYQKLAWEAVRNILRAEGFKSPLWDTGRREKVDGQNVIVWGVAR